MANEITVSASLYAYKAGSMSASVGRGANGVTFTMTGTVLSQGTVSVGFAAAEAIPLGEVTGPHWCWLKNLDATNYVLVRNGLAGADLIKLRAGEFCVFPMYDSAVPYWIANTAACLCEWLILQL